MDRIQDVVGLAVLGALSTSISATFGVITLLLTGAEIQSVVWTVWYTWWIGDFMGALVIAPLFLVWHTNWPVKWGRRKIVEVRCDRNPNLTGNRICLSHATCQWGHP